MSTKASVLSFVDTLTYNLADTAQTPRLFDEVIQELGHMPEAWLTKVATQTLSAPAIAVTLDPTLNIVRLLAVFWQDRQLSHATFHELDAYDPRWRDRPGAPVSYVTEGEDDRVLRLYPAPKVVNTTGTLTIDPDISYIFTEQRASVPDYLDLPVALMVIAREFERESNHRDADFSAIARALALDMLRMVA